MITPHRILRALLAAMVIVAAASPLVVQASEESLRLASPGKAQLAAADLAPDGRMLVAWKDTDALWSQIQVLQNGREVHRWSFSGELVQDVSWTVGGQQLVASVVTELGPEHRLYRVGTKGQLTLQWSSRQLDDRYDVVTLNQDGSAWMGTSFSSDAARVGVGRVGQKESVREWEINGEKTRRPSALSVEEYSYGFFLSGTSEPLGFGVLWGARLWIGQVGQDLVELVPPAECQQIQMATSTAAGLWVQCYRGMDAKPSHSWSLYPESSLRSDAEPVAEEVFRAPSFLPDGTVIDLFRREGRAEVYESAGAGGLAHLGSFDIPQDARLLVSGEGLLEEIDGTEEYRVVSLSDRLAALRQPAAGAKP